MPDLIARFPINLRRSDVSAIRVFPKGCGRFKVNPNLNLNVELDSNDKEIEESVSKMSSCLKVIIEESKRGESKNNESLEGVKVDGNVVEQAVVADSNKLVNESFDSKKIIDENVEETNSKKLVNGNVGESLSSKKNNIENVEESLSSKKNNDENVEESLSSKKNNDGNVEEEESKSKKIVNGNVDEASKSKKNNDENLEETSSEKLANWNVDKEPCNLKRGIDDNVKDSSSLKKLVNRDVKEVPSDTSSARFVKTSKVSAIRVFPIGCSRNVSVNNNKARSSGVGPIASSESKATEDELEVGTTVKNICDDVMKYVESCGNLETEGEELDGEINHESDNDDVAKSVKVKSLSGEKKESTEVEMSSFKKLKKEAKGKEVSKNDIVESPKMKSSEAKIENVVKKKAMKKTKLSGQESTNMKKVTSEDMLEENKEKKSSYQSLEVKELLATKGSSGITTVTSHGKIVTKKSVANIILSKSGKSMKRKLQDEEVDESLEAYGDKLIVQALMSAKIFPWNTTVTSHGKIVAKKSVAKDIILSKSGKSMKKKLQDEEVDESLEAYGDKLIVQALMSRGLVSHSSTARTKRQKATNSLSHSAPQHRNMINAEDNDDESQLLNTNNVDLESNSMEIENEPVSEMSSCLKVIIEESKRGESRNNESLEGVKVDGNVVEQAVAVDSNKLVNENLEELGNSKKIIKENVDGGSFDSKKIIDENVEETNLRKLVNGNVEESFSSKKNNNENVECLSSKKNNDENVELSLNLKKTNDGNVEESSKSKKLVNGNVDETCKSKKNNDENLEETSSEKLVNRNVDREPCNLKRAINDNVKDSSSLKKLVNRNVKEVPSDISSTHFVKTSKASAFRVFPIGCGRNVSVNNKAVPLAFGVSVSLVD